MVGEFLHDRACHTERPSKEHPTYNQADERCPRNFVIWHQEMI